MDAGTGQRRMAPKSQHFAETSYLEPGVVPVAGVYVWPVGGSGVADGEGRWETLLTVLVPSAVEGHGGQVATMRLKTLSFSFKYFATFPV